MALQGAFLEHARALQACGARTRLVRLPEDMEGLDGLVIPGGESTTMTKLMDRMHLTEVVRSALAGGLPALATCAGMIVLAHRVSDGIEGQASLDILPIAVRRNGYGRQLESFEAAVELEGLEGPSFPGVFIRSPVVIDSGPTQVLARVGGDPVGLRHGKVLALCFHPELSGDLRLHQEFLRMVAG